MKSNLLLVDDEQGILTVLSISLSDLGYHVYTAVDGAQGLELFRRLAPDIVITDIRMPVMDGIALLKQIKSENPETEVIVLTGHGDMKMAIQCLKLEAVDFVLKPIDDNAMEIALKRANDKIAMRSQLNQYTQNLERLVEEKSARLVAAERRAAVAQALTGFTAAMQHMAGDFGSGLGYFNDLPCFVSIHAADGTVVAANDLLTARFGDPTGHPGSELYSTNEEKAFSSPAAKTFSLGAGQRVDAVMTTSDGRLTPVVVYTAPINDADGNTRLVVEIAADISQIRRLQEELAASEQRYQQLFDMAPCYITVQDRDLRITAANQRFEQDFGLRTHRDYCYQAYQQRNQACEQCPVVLTFADGRPHQCELTAWPETGLVTGPRRMLVWTSPLKDDAGNITHVMEMSTDITEMRRLQDQLTHLGSVIGSLSHGIKGLLTGLDGGIYMLDSGFAQEDMPRIREGWDVVRLMIGRIRNMVQDILTYAKGREISWKKKDAASLVGDLETVFRPKTDQAGIDLVCRFDPDLSDYEIDAGIAGAILTNILDNALDACTTENDQSKKHVIQFTAQGEGQYVVCKVIDNGPGMKPETLSKIFTPHFLSRKEHGSGLGLYLAYQILKTIHGRMSVDSTVGKGTWFEIHLPRARREERKTDNQQ